ncbi:uncharacterized protein C16orf78 homolog [Diceros bicornis minor]|uniref:uncharacterized protein C16orf78 homolog n=1 Tax=Diceros bicornis minor TaxID=77932 RepID=UPI0026EA2F37|nr:uncharacterized protein C16orf78 homolog [Diceros bicornis minor]
MSEKSQDLKDLMPEERKSMWRTAEERRMSDLTRVLEWLERRHGRKKQALQKHKSKMVTSAKATGRDEKRAQKPQEGNRHVAFSAQASGQSTKKDGNPVLYRKLYGVDPMGKHFSIVPGNYAKDGPGKADLDIKDAIALESTQRSTAYRRQSIIEPTLQDTIFGARRPTLLRDWVLKTPDTSYERKLKTLMEKGMEPRVEMARMLKPEEVLSCRYLRLSKNNIRTLLKLCKDAGMNVDIHPHMVEGEIDAKKVFARNRNVAL